MILFTEQTGSHLEVNLSTLTPVSLRPEKEGSPRNYL